MIPAVHPRRTSSYLVAMLALAFLGFSSTAAATPTVSFTAKIAPIPGFPGTGVLGAGAMIEGQGTISGDEYAGGSPPPLTQIKVFVPKGLTLHSQGFPECSSAILESHEVQKCPKGSKAGGVGSATGVVSFGEERVNETVSLQPYFDQSGELAFFVEGKTPVSIEFLVAAHTVASSVPSFGKEMIFEVPLIETVPEAPDASAEHGSISVGAAYKQGGKTISYITLPKQCPRGGFPGKAQLSFLGGAVVEVYCDLPCPKR